MYDVEPRFHQENLAKHRVDPTEAAEALSDGWRKRRRVGDFYEVLGKTGDGRHLQLIAEVDRDAVWVFHGREMTKSERQRYERK